MQVADLTAKLVLDIEYKGDPAALRYLHAHRERRFRYIALFGTWFVVLAIAWLALGCGSSVTLAETSWQPTMFGRSNSEQMQAAVRVETGCITGDPWRGGLQIAGAWGSGAITRADTVLTAYHVVECAAQSTRIVRVVTSDGVTHWAELEASYPERDLARLRAPGLRAAPVSIVPPTPGEYLCAATAHPARELKCGSLKRRRAIKTERNGTVDIVHTITVPKGNSGSGLYDGHGYLVGVVTNRLECDEDGPPLLRCGLGSSVVGWSP